MRLVLIAKLLATMIVLVVSNRGKRAAKILLAIATLARQSNTIGREPPPRSIQVTE